QRHLMARLRHMAEHDALTDLYNREKFFTASRAMLDQHPDETFAFVRFDIDRFRLINSFFGEAEGNRLLQFIADKMREFAAAIPYVTYGRMEADVFCFCEVYSDAHFQRLIQLTQQELRNFSAQYYVEPSFGVYVITDAAIPVETMYSRAAMAAERCKGNHLQNFAFYDSAISEELFRTQSILNDMDAALEQRQFVVYLQPKYDLRSEKPYGAEALVRWQHPERGLLQPGAFIPVFEHNGFISKIDYYVWEEVCRLLHRWIDEGQSPAPISVNVSRMNMYNPHLVKVLSTLVERYDVPPALLQLELTESAYMDNPASMKETLKKLHEAGFVVLMDDFGSGYSSLNTLRDIAVDILKIDMKFLPAGTTDGRSERILTSVIRMAGWLGIPVVVEGVETAQQRDFLKSVGCGYIQGYFYARPMPVAEYETLMQTDEQAEPPLPITQESQAVLENLWRTDFQRDIILRHISQPVLICEVLGEETEVLRVNQAYLTWMYRCDEIVSLRQLCRQYITPEFWPALRQTLSGVIRE
ncbi:MAG: bifunctional diguanylate cyclase/phosphodiesterase, partial [Oscillibacter sp.]